MAVDEGLNGLRALVVDDNDAKRWGARPDAWPAGEGRARRAGAARHRPRLLTASETGGHPGEADVQGLLGEPVTGRPGTRRHFRDPLDAPSVAAGAQVTLAHGREKKQTCQNVPNERVATRLSERLGCRVGVAADGRKAAVAVTTARDAAVLMDGRTPATDGCRATAATRGSEAGPPIRVIAMTPGAMS